jgi:D-xylose transport system substrate-binding protein
MIVNRMGRKGLAAAAAVSALSLSLAACSSTSSGGASSSAAAPAASASTAASTAASASAAASGGAAAPTNAIVYFMQPNTTPTRYLQQDGPFFEAALKKLDPSITVKFVNAEGDSAKQQSQVQTAIADGAKALVIVAADPNTSAGLLGAAEEANVPVIGYENPPLNGTLNSQVLFDPKNAGQVQGQYFADQVNAGAFGATPVKIARLYGNKGDEYTTQMLDGQNEFIQPLIDAGKIKVVCEDYIKNWDPANAQTAMTQCLTKTQNGVDAVLGFYDGITAGAIAALDAQGLTPKIPVYGGQNPELSGLQYMITGQQVDNVFKSFPKEADAAAQLTYAALLGEAPPEPPISTTINNGAMDVPTALLSVDYIHLEEGVDVATIIQPVVDAGIFTWEQICTGPAAETDTCKAQLG